MIGRILERRERSLFGIGLRVDVTEVVLAKDLGVPTTGTGVESYVVPDRSDEVGDTV